MGGGATKYSKSCQNKKRSIRESPPPIKVVGDEKIERNNESSVRKSKLQVG
jgi:hypothetical protein